MPPNSNFRLPRGHRFRPKFDFTVMAQSHGVDHLGSTLWPVGSHWVQRMGQNRKKLPCPKNSIMWLRFRPKFDFMVMAQTHGVDHLGSTLWTMGSHWVQKKGQNRKKLPWFEFSTTPRSSISTKIRLYGYGAKSRWGLPRVHLGANGIIGSKNRKKLPCPQIRLCDYDFDQNSTLRLWLKFTV